MLQRWLETHVRSDRMQKATVRDVAVESRHGLSKTHSRWNVLNKLEMLTLHFFVDRNSERTWQRQHHSSSHISRKSAVCVSMCQQHKHNIWRLCKVKTAKKQNASVWRKTSTVHSLEQSRKRMSSIYVNLRLEQLPLFFTLHYKSPFLMTTLSVGEEGRKRLYQALVWTVNTARERIRQWRQFLE